MSKKEFTFIRANTVKKGYQILESCENRLTYVIVSGKNSREFMKLYPEKAKKHRLVTANIIYCHDADKKAGLMEEDFYLDPFLNPGGIATSFEQIYNYIISDENGFYSINPNNYNPKGKKESDEGYGHTFCKVDAGSKGFAIEHFQKYFNKPQLIQTELFKFSSFIFETYGNLEFRKLAFPALEKKISLPTEIYSTNYLKMYMNNDISFFSDMCKDLTNDQFESYLPYIYIMYSGVKDKAFPSFSGSLYRGTVMLKEEVDELMNMKGVKKVFCKPFLSFSKDKDIAEQFIKTSTKNTPDSVPCRIIIKELNKMVLKTMYQKDVDSLFYPNIKTGSFSKFAQYEEILILPFAEFFINKIGMKNDVLEIELTYDFGNSSEMLGMDSLYAKDSNK